jgi:peptide-N4-(N-acetyl-beta-glucosaminyl)asparagine amidase
MPIDRFHDEARAQLEAEALLGFEELVLKAMLRWFKFEFFRWVDRLPCEYCRVLNRITLSRRHS